MRFGIYAPNFGEFSDPHKLLTLARTAEASGWDGFFCGIICCSAEQSPFR
jgi:hypothetical protein